MPKIPNLNVAGARARALKEELDGKMLYKFMSKPHQTFANPQPVFPTRYDWNEPFKPVGKYWAEDLNGTTIVSGPKRTLSLTHAKSDADKYVRGVVPKDTKIMDLHEGSLKDQYDQALRGHFEAQGLRGEDLANAMANISGENSTINAYREQMTKNLKDQGYQFARIHGVDNTPGATELIQLQPQIVNAFWRNKKALLSAPAAGLLPLLNQPKPEGGM